MSIELRYRKWFAYLTVPADVRAKLGRRVFRQTLRTDSRAVAERRAAILVAAWKAQIEDARGKPGTDDAAFWQGSALAPARRRAKELHSDGSGRTRGEVHDMPRDDDDPAVWRDALRRARTPEERDLVLELIEDKATDIYRRTENRSEAEAFHAAAHQIPTDSHLDEWIASLRVTAGVRDTRRTDVLRLAGKFPNLAMVVRPALNRYATELLKEGLAIGTVGRILGAHRLYWKFLQSVGAVPDSSNPFDRMDIGRQVRREASRPSRRPFAPADVRALWEAAGAGGDAMLADLVLLLAYEGSRLEEICSLRTQDVDLAGATFTIRQAKSAAGVRTVPLHTAARGTMARLIEASTDGYVISGERTDKYGRRQNRLGKRGGALIRKLGHAPTITLHSIRKCVVTMLERAAVPEGTTQDLIGHARSTLAGRTYSGGSTLEMKRAAIELLSYP